MLGQALPIGIDVTSPVTWFVVIVACVVMALTVSTRRANTRPRAAAREWSAPGPASTGDARARSVGDWAAAQALFLEDPRAGCARALAIVETLLREREAARGGPEPTDPRSVAGRAAILNPNASTDELRRAFVALRALFDERR